MKKSTTSNTLAAILELNAQEREALGFTARVLVQATFPHRRVAGNEWSRTNGMLTVCMLAPSSVGLPYGSYPRLLTTWLTGEALRNKQRKRGEDMRRIELGHSLSGFMAELGLSPTSGCRGTVGYLRDQMDRLFSTTIVARTVGDDPATGLHGRHIRPRTIADDTHLWWSPHDPGQGVVWGSYVVLSGPFFDLLTERPVPVDLDVLRLIKRSPLALDLYYWATYRLSYLKRPTVIPWAALMGQFGAGYPDTAQGRRNFKKHVAAGLGKIQLAWPALRAEPTAAGLRLRPGRPHVPPKPPGELSTARGD